MLLELTMYWLPLIALVLSSLGLIVLKRVSGLPPWVQRLTDPPFYFVSVPIATLIVGIEILAIGVLAYVGWCLVYHNWLLGIGLIFLWTVCLVTGFSPPVLTDQVVGLLPDTVVLVAFCAAQFLGGRLLWRTLWRDSEREYPSNKTMQHLKILFLLFVFARVFLNIRHFVLTNGGGALPVI